VVDIHLLLVVLYLPREELFFFLGHLTKIPKHIWAIRDQLVIRSSRQMVHGKLLT
jgi:hypothetical protein